jgi:hypothetical protein
MPDTELTTVRKTFSGHVAGSGNSKDETPSPISQLKITFPDRNTEYLQAILQRYEMNIELAVPAVQDNLIESTTETAIPSDEIDDVTMQLSNDDNLKQNTDSQQDSYRTAKELLASVAPRPGKPRMELIVSRTNLLENAIAFFKSGQYHHDRALQVQFEGEPAVHGGRPRREFFSLLLKKLLCPTSPIRFFEGRPGRYLPIHNVDALVGGLFKVCGQIIAASALQGGSGFPCLAPPIYTYLATMSLDKAMDSTSIQDLPDPFVAEALQKISELEDGDPEFADVASSLSDSLTTAGYTHQLTSNNKADAMLKILRQDVLLSRKAELDQLAEGLGPVLEIIQRNPDVMRPYYTSTIIQPLTAESFLDICSFESTIPANLKAFFVQYVYRAGSEKLARLLQFCTGSLEVPMMGFHDPERITVSTVTSVYPNAATCSMILELPVQCVSEEQLRDSLDSVLDIQSTGFGVV